jgi:hypothetical protein
MDTLELDITEANELTFKIQIEGATAPANIRLVCEGSDVSYMFKAHRTHEIDTFDFVLPVMKNKLQEGVYKGRVEVLIENKYFAPVEFEMNFKQPVKVVAEAIQKREIPRVTEPKVSITASPVMKSVSPSVQETVDFGQSRTPGIASQASATTSVVTPKRTLRDKFGK